MVEATVAEMGLAEDIFPTQSDATMATIVATANSREPFTHCVVDWPRRLLLVETSDTAAMKTA